MCRPGGQVAQSLHKERQSCPRTQVNWRRGQVSDAVVLKKCSERQMRTHPFTNHQGISLKIVCCGSVSLGGPNIEAGAFWVSAVLTGH